MRKLSIFCLQFGGGGGISSRNLSITDNPGPVIFRENLTTGSGGAISSTNCTISNNRNLCCFINNVSSPTGTSSSNGGAINSTEIEISHNFGPIQFLNNVTRNNGGALKADHLRITDNFGEISFRNNKCLKKNSNGGVADATETVTISNNHAPITFIDNQAGNNGCIYTKICTISNNDAIIKFINNNAHLDEGNNFGGGAIQSTTCSITNNRQGIIFANNSTRNNGGGIYTNELTIKDNGPVLFLNNSSTWGGAFQSTNSGTGPFFFYLSADYGDIIFNGNFKTRPPQPNQRNALHSAKTGGGLKLHIGAREGYRVAFYDPIEHEHATAHVLTFNPESHHLGTVLFSGATVPGSLQDEANFTSYLRNTSLINYGVVAIEDKAMLAAFKLTQNEGTLRLGDQAVLASTGTGITTPNSSGSSIVIQRLALNLPSILKRGAEAPKIWIYPSKSGTGTNITYSEDNNPSITISGPLTLLDDNNQNPYDSLDLSGGITKVPFLYLCDNATQKINIDNLDIEAINSHRHYGYQGIWSPHWEEYTTTAVNTSPLTANTSHRILYADWTPTYYIPNPQYRGNLVANALWQAVYNLTTGLHTLENCPQERKREISGGALGAYVIQKTRKSLPGFDLFSKGYSTKVLGSSETQHLFALSFAQFYSQINENTQLKNTVSSNCYFTGAQLQIPWFYDILTTASAGYLYSHSKIKTHEKQQISSQGLFCSHTLGAECVCLLPEGNIQRFLFHPFIKAQGIRATQETFTETGSNIRNFKIKTPLTNVTLPLGILCHIENRALLDTSWEFQFAYTPTVYRKNPEILTTRLISKGMWLTSATHVDHHAGSLSVKNITTLKNKSLTLNYRGDFSKSTLCNFLNVTAQIQF